MWFWLFIAVVILALLPYAVRNALVALHLIVVAFLRVVPYIAIAGAVAFVFYIVRGH